MLQDSYGLTGRRLAVQANTDLGSLPFYTHANWSRGTASGGGLYPVGVHWITGAERAAHARRLLLRHPAPRVTACWPATSPARCGRPSATCRRPRTPTSSWSSASRSGRTPSSTTASATTPSRWTSARCCRPGGCGPAPTACSWAARCGSTRPARAGCSGSTRPRRGVFAVVPLRWDGQPGGAGRHRRRDRAAGRGCAASPTQELSRACCPSRRCDRDPRGHAGRAPPTGRRPARWTPRSPPPAGPAANALPAARRPQPLDVPVRQRAARTAQQLRPVHAASRRWSRDRLSAALAASVAAGTLDSDAESPRRRAADQAVRLRQPRARRAARAVRVRPRRPASSWLVKDGRLRRLPPAATTSWPTTTWSRRRAVLVPAARTHAVLDAVGDRGYRLVNAADRRHRPGRLHRCARPPGPACGVALGFDSVSFERGTRARRTGRAPAADHDDRPRAAPARRLPLRHRRPVTCTTHERGRA